MSTITLLPPNKKFKMTKTPMALPRNVWGTIFSFLGVGWGYNHLGIMSREMYDIVHCKEVLEKIPWVLNAMAYDYAWGRLFTENLKELVTVIGTSGMDPGVWETVQKNRQTILPHMKHIIVWNKTIDRQYGYGNTDEWERFMLDVFSSQLNNIEILTAAGSILQLPSLPKLTHLKILQSTIKTKGIPDEIFPSLQHVSIDCDSNLSSNFFKFQNLITYTIRVCIRITNAGNITDWKLLRKNIYGMMMNHMPKEYIRIDAKLIGFVIDENNSPVGKEEPMNPTKKQFLDRCHELKNLGKLKVVCAEELKKRHEDIIKEIKLITQRKEEYDLFL